MVCVVVTRGGEGPLWLYRSVEEATDHPLTQGGDAICESAEDVLGTFRLPEIATLAGQLGDVKLQQAASNWTDVSVSRQDREHYASQLWTLMKRLAPKPSEDPSEIVRLIRLDRVHFRKTLRQIHRLHPYEKKGLKMTDVSNTAEKTKSNLPKREPKFAGTTVITLGTDKEGAKFGPSNNPKKEGSKSHARFAKYVDGMTVDQAIEAGISRADIDNDQTKGLITLA